MTKYRHIAALGSSFAAGPGIQPVADAVAMRSQRNYAHLLAERLGAELSDLTVSGATTATILNQPQMTATGVQFPPQIDGLPAHSDLVTVTAGGNDLNFAASMLYQAWLAADPGGPFVAMMGQQFAGGIPDPDGAAIDAMAQGLVDIVYGVRSRATGAHVVLVDYLTVAGNNTRRDADWPFSADQTAEFLRIQAAIARGYRIAAARTGAEMLIASELSVGHALGSPEPWVFGFQPVLESTAWSFHPNEHGMLAIADALTARLGD